MWGVLKAQGSSSLLKDMTAGQTGLDMAKPGASRFPPVQSWDLGDSLYPTCHEGGTTKGACGHMRLGCSSMKGKVPGAPAL